MFDTCVCCGREIPEGRQVCLTCESIKKNTVASPLYVCNQKKCDNCSAPLCRYTTDVKYAKYFSHDDIAEVWYEDPRKFEKEVNNDQT